jgi:hypothetical protein
LVRLYHTVAGCGRMAYAPTRKSSASAGFHLAANLTIVITPSIISN